MTDTNTAERDSFEAHYRRCGANDATLSRWVDDGSTPPAMVGKYIIRSVQDAWLAFQAGRASLAASAGSEPVAPAAPPMGGEIALIEKAVKRVGIKSLLNYGAGSLVYSEGVEGVTQDDLLAYTREIALHCAVALGSPPEGMAGWKLVPIEPTPEMVSAAFDAVEIGSFPGFATGNDARSAIYRAMVEAAPPTSRI